MSVEGMRVVRGPDWNHGGEDGGEGHVGTVSQDNQDDTVAVMWDMGGETTCRIGKGGKLDLLILDSAPTGLKHAGVTCGSCSKSTIVGARWQCGKCPDVNLCTPCYFHDKHDIQHGFKRIDTAGAKGETVPKRSISVRLRALGTYAGASVKRGTDWSYGSQDGGSGNIGTVAELKNYTNDGAERNAVSVTWPNQQSNTYRLGYRGKVDLICVEECPGTDYYRDHLQPLKTVSPTSEGGTGSESLSDSTCDSVGGAKPKVGPKPSIPPRASPLQKGDKVCVDLPEIALKEAQRGHGGWSMRMAECIGQIGTVKQIETNGDVVISYDGKDWKFFSGAVRKVPAVKVGDMVRILSDQDKVRAMQKRHGGWQADMVEVLGKVGKVVKIDSDGDVAVAFGGQAWVFNPGCCEPAPGCKPEFLDDKSGGSDDVNPGSGGGGGGGSSGGRGGSGSSGPDADEKSNADDAAEILQKLARLLVTESLGAQIGPQQLVAASSKGDYGAVRAMLKQNPNLVNRKFKGLTPLIIASHEGHTLVVDALLAAGADKDVTDEKGTTPLMAALMKRQEGIAEKLIQQGANINKVSMSGRNALHAAALNGANSILRVLLQKGANLNQQDAFGDTPMHDAVAAKNNSGLAFLVADSRASLHLVNKKGMNVLQLAAMKDDEIGASRILVKAPELVNSQKSDGYAPLHIAAVNNHTDVAKTLIKAKADVNMESSGGLTPLHLACHQGYQEMAKLLIENSANITCQDSDGDTPLHFVLLGDRRDGASDDMLARLLGLRVVNERENQDRTTLACFLIQQGASVTVRNHSGRTPLEVCSNDKIRNAVRAFAQRNAPQGQSRQPSAGAMLEELLLELPIPCAGCHGKMADARLIPCRHKVLCKRCSFRVRECPACHRTVTERQDLRGNTIEMVDPCKVQ